MYGKIEERFIPRKEFTNRKKGRPFMSREK